VREDATPQKTSYNYDLAGRRTMVTHPDPDGPGGASAAYQGFSYDDKGDVVTRWAEDGYATWYKRDWRGEVLEKRVGWSQGVLLESFAYDALGRPTMASVGAPLSSTSTVQLWYGNAGTSGWGGGSGNGYVDEPVKETQTVSGVTKTILRASGRWGSRRA
jgi:hypothetical protein